MSAARDQMLTRIRRANQVAAGAPRPPVVRDYRAGGDVPAGHPELVDRLEERLVDYRATVVRASGSVVGEVASVVARQLELRGAALLTARAAPGLNPIWNPGVPADDSVVPAVELDAVSAAVTGAAVAIAETGTIVLDATPNCGRRALTLLPDLHLCLVTIDQIVGQVPEAIPRLDPTRPLTWISGPSATSDIELQRVEGVHGPRHLVVVLVTP